jgi:hypothetical protein
MKPNAKYKNSKAMKDKVIRFVKGDRVKVCNELNTTIERYEYIELFEEYFYWFKDENGKLWNVAASDLELI